MRENALMQHLQHHGEGDDGINELTFPAHPYQPPYDIQLGFMRALYRTLEQGGVGLFESPTGTGKTLSLICASLQWLEDLRQREVQQQAQPPGAGAATAAALAAAPAAPAGTGAAGSDDEEPDWMRDFSLKAKEEEAQREAAQQRQKQLQAVREGLLAKRAAGAARQEQARRQQQGEDLSDPDAEFLMEDWQKEDGWCSGGEGSDSGALGSAAKRRRLSGDGDGARQGLLAYDSEDDEDGSRAEGEGALAEQQGVELPQKTQIIFSSRTHSQLSQFVGELQRTPYNDSVSLLALASRKALCINDLVLRLGSPSLINERCLEMQRGGGRKKKKGSGRCPFLACDSQAAATTHDIILAQPMDIEELAALGRRKSVCPYYAARRALPEADVVLAPYSSLLVEEAREAAGLSLAGNVVIVDEGHNLVDAINSSHSAELSAGQLAAARSQLAAYFERFRTQLAPGNARYLQLLMSVADNLARHLKSPPSPGGGPAAAPTAQQQPQHLAQQQQQQKLPGRKELGDSGSSNSSSSGTGGGSVAVQSVNDFLLGTGMDNLNLFKLVRHVRESKAVFKVAGYAQAQRSRAAAAAAAGGTAAAAVLVAGSAPQKCASTAAGCAAGVAGAAGGAASAVEGSTGALHALVGFLQALTNDDANGRVILDRQAGTLRFVLLNAAAHFAKVVAAARSVVLASGTLSPIEPVLQLFPLTPRDSIHHFSCGHVVGRDRLLALAVGSGPSGGKLDFRHESRAAPATLDELGRLVVNVSKVVPGGLVVFFPSFSYANTVHARWQASGMLRQLTQRKRVFREPRGAGEVEALLQEYAACIKACGSGGDSSSTGVGGCSGGGIGSLGAAAASAGGGTAGAAAARGKENAGVSGGSGGGGGGLTGAVLLCVVGGKLSEGINFGDALGRCVVVVGMPYPNPSDPELQERMRFIDRQAAQQAQQAAEQALLQQLGQPPPSVITSGAVTALTPHRQPALVSNPQLGTCMGPSSAPAAAASQAVVPASSGSSDMQYHAIPSSSTSQSPSRQYYEDLCMKAVNQCVGRVVRHRHDYAAVLLVDARYAASAANITPSSPSGGGGGSGGAAAIKGPLGPLSKLPGWVRESLVAPPGGGFGTAYAQLARFFKQMEAAPS